MSFIIKHPVFAILPHVWGKMTFVVGQVDDTPPKPISSLIGRLFVSYSSSRFSVIVSDHMKKNHDLL